MNATHILTSFGLVWLLIGYTLAFLSWRTVSHTHYSFRWYTYVVAGALWPVTLCLYLISFYAEMRQGREEPDSRRKK